MTDFHALTIADIHNETADTVSIAFAVPAALADVYRFKPGQHLTVRVSHAGEELRRTYSICSSPDAAVAHGERRIAVKRIPGGRFSDHVVTGLAVGRTLDVLPPTGRFVLPPPASDGRGRLVPRHLLAFAAGSGITPVMAMLEAALAREPDSRFTLVYGNRTMADVIFRSRLEDLKDRHMARFTLVHVLSRNDESDAPLSAGRIDAAKVPALLAAHAPPRAIAHAFVCGPGTMIRDIRNALTAAGVAREVIHHEFFAAGGGAARGTTIPVPSAPAPHATPVAKTAAAVGEVIAILDGARHRFPIGDGEHVVDAAIRAGVKVPYACKGGMCCTCRARVVEGAATMTMNYSLEPWEQEKGFVLTCQARPTTPRLVVDYDAM